MGMCISYKIKPTIITPTTKNNENNSSISSVSTLSYINNNEEYTIKLDKPAPECIVRNNTIYILYGGQSIAMPIKNNDNMDITEYKKICLYG
jgi:hypothetical protein